MAGEGTLGGDRAAAVTAGYEDGFATLEHIALDPAESVSLIERIARESS